MNSSLLSVILFFIVISTCENMAEQLSSLVPESEKTVEESRLKENAMVRSGEYMGSTGGAFCRESKKVAKGLDASQQESKNQSFHYQSQSRAIVERWQERSLNYDRVAHAIDREIMGFLESRIAAVAEAGKVTSSTKLQGSTTLRDLNATQYRLARSSVRTIDELVAESLFAARMAREVAEEAREAAKEANEESMAAHRLLDILDESISTIRQNVHGFMRKSNDGDDRTSAIYQCLALKYESGAKSLIRQKKKVEVSLIRAQEIAIEANRTALSADRVVDEQSEDSKYFKIVASYAKLKAEATCVVALKIEHSALAAVKGIFVDLAFDAVKLDDDSSSDEYSRKCANRDRKTRIAHVAAFAIGIAFLGLTGLFEVGSDSFYAILSLGTLTTGWATIYWIHQIYSCCRKCKNDTPVLVEEDERRDESRDELITNINNRLVHIERHLQRYSIVPDFALETELGLMETVRIDDIPQ